MEEYTEKRNELIGHILRHDGLLLLILECVIDGKNHRGRPRLQYISQIMEDQGCNSYQELKRKASDREAWKLLQPIIRLNTAERERERS